MKGAAHGTAADTSQAVDEFMDALEHPHKDAIEALRRLILGVDSRIAEGIKWKSPSFRTTEYFATTNLRARTGVGVILHLGAKVRDLPAGGLKIDDAEKLLKWLGKDRAMVEFSDAADLRRKAAAFRLVIRQWIGHV